MKPKILVLGSGGRAHAIAWKLALTLGHEHVYVAPGNGGIPNAYALDISDFEAIRSFCIKHRIGMIFVGPEQPLSEGIVDFFKDTSIQVLGPDKQAARLESSKIFAKKFMKKYGVRTADFQAFDRTDKARDFIREKQGNLVVKFDGLAGGKGVYVCSSADEALEALNELEKKYGKKVRFLIEDKIPGDEVSLIGFTDGRVIKTLLPSQDHKQLLDGDRGPNTGGMGAYCPVKISNEIMQDIRTNIVEPTLKGIKEEGFHYKGVIYFGIMVKDGKAYLLEYNVRFGDPEAQVLLPSLQTDLYAVAEACLNGNLSEIRWAFHPGYFVDLVLVSEGYPGKYETGKEIKGLERLDGQILIFHAGTTKKNGKILTRGGRVLNLVAHDYELNDALKKVYNAAKKIYFEGMFYRKDIGQRKNKELIKKGNIKKT